MTRSGSSTGPVTDPAPVRGRLAAEPVGALTAPVDPAPLPGGIAVVLGTLVPAVEGPSVGRAVALRPDDPWSEAGRKILGFHLARVLARVPGVLAGEDAEEVHAMRVATRRMRAAWRVFGDGFERGEVRRYRAELRDIGASLGGVRDLDVLIGILVAYVEQRNARQRAGLEPLLAAWRLEREARRVKLVAVLESDGFAAFIRDYQALAGTAGHAALVPPPNTPGLVRNRMPATIWSAYQDVWAFDGDLQAADLATLHELRIAAKWLRYTLEFVRESLEPDATALIRPVVALQDHLGDQHDQHVAAELAREFVATSACGPAELKAIGRFTAHLDGEVERLRRTIRSTWPPIVGSRYRRSLGRAVARL